MSDRFLIRCKPQQGYNKIFDVGERKMKLTKFGVVKLAAVSGRKCLKRSTSSAAAFAT